MHSYHAFRASQPSQPGKQAFWRRPKMKSIANRLFLFSAAALSLGTVAYGQTTLIADVPFGFQMPGGATAAGQYTVQMDSTGSGKIVHINNRQTRRSALSIADKLD